MKQICIAGSRVQTRLTVIFAILLVSFVGIVADTADARKKNGSGYTKYSNKESVDFYHSYLHYRGLGTVLKRNDDGTFIAPRAVSQDTEVLLAPYGERKHPLTVKTDSGSDYYVKLQRAGDTANAPVITMFIRGGETLSAKVPSGNYELKYATGNGWYGKDYLFWEDTRFYKTDDTFEFNVDASPTEGGILHTYDGYTIELIKRASGNLETIEISASEF